MSFRFLRPNAQSVWENKEILSRFSRYKAILDQKKLARYLISKTIKCGFTPEDSIETLENLVHAKSQHLNQLLEERIEVLQQRKNQEENFITLVSKIAMKYLESCIFCERRCGANRAEGEKGLCLVPSGSYVSSAFLHYGEESVLVPSGTIFFQGCNFTCIFCQNYDISQEWKGRRDISDVSQYVSANQLAELADTLSKKGALNINYVGGDPIPNIHTIIANLEFQTANITQLWNSNFYLTDEALSLIIDLIDFWLPDFKYGNNDCAKKYSGIENYYEVLTRNLKRIHDEGSGEIIIRHLVMPNHVECCSKPILDFVAKEIPKSVVNIMGQYRPVYHACNYEEINRRPSSEEMQQVQNYADKLGILWRPVS
ncbi:MAG: Radical SAM superfamily protein [Promethearchaeota archaeon]|nr:MAG: Radical SAM superfamily protein [Candidatus Lokiarchaeota archaeon]